MKNSQETLNKNISRKSFGSIFAGNEMILILCIIGLSALMTIINPMFFSANTLFEMLRACVVTGIIAIGVGLVMINGGVDLSCMSIAIFSGYATTQIMVALDYQGSVFLMFVIGVIIGAFLGLCNAMLIAFLKIPIFIATLCAGVIYRGIMFQFIGHIYVTPANMPPGAMAFAGNTILGGLHVSVFILISLLLLAHLLLRYTVVGRGVFAMGGALISAQRIGYNVKRLNIMLYTFAGAMYGIGGIAYVTNNRMADPGGLAGTELVAVSSVVLGGVAITGGKGSMLGVFLGTLLTILIRNNLILMGVSSDWQAFVFGVVLIAAIALQAYQRNRAQKGKA